MKENVLLRVKKKVQEAVESHGHMYPGGIFHREREDLLGKFVQMDEGKSIRKRNRSVSDSKTGICGDS